MTPLRATIAIVAMTASATLLSPRAATADTSKVPTPAEWKSAPQVKLARQLPSTCTAIKVREWMRIRCECDLPTGGAFLTGNQKDVYFYADKPINEWGGPDFTKPGFAEVIFAVRKNDRRIMQLTQAAHSGGYGGPSGQRLLMLISETWLPTQDAPVITFSHQG